MQKEVLKGKLKNLINDSHQILVAIYWTFYPDQAKKNNYPEPKKVKPTSIESAYQNWFAATSALLKGFSPDRHADFIDHYYADKKRKEITYEKYKIEDWMIGLTINLGGRPIFDKDNSFFTRFQQQILILKSALESFDYIAESISDTIQADLFDTELDTAEELLKKKHLRAAGIVAGVVLEGHLKSICTKHEIKFKKKKPTLSDFYEGLKQKDVIDVPTWRHIQRLADIRNLCGHKADREPVDDEIEDIIRGTKKIITSVF
ncbi:MAG: hypothetical protein PWQ57_3098 [Desulfovibrionales bacterium]|nr:hypothetical protein [Desulfovibrionales bacterium]